MYLLSSCNVLRVMHAVVALQVLTVDGFALAFGQLLGFVLRRGGFRIRTDMVWLWCSGGLSLGHC